MQRFIDLHTHTVYSDGSMTPAQLVRHAKENGLAAIAVTDHDTVSGVSEAMDEGAHAGLEVIPGIELSAQADTETHILGFYIDIHNQNLQNALRKAVDSRRERIAKTGEALKRLGFDIPLHEVFALAPEGLVGRAHYAKLMMEKGYVKSVKEAFERYLSFGCPAYCGRQAMTARECVELIKACGGYAFLAHPHLTKKTDGVLLDFLKELQGYGLDGLEGYYTDYTPEMQQKYQTVAQQLGLKICGGTDFHADMKPHIKIGVGLGNLNIPYSVLKNIRDN
ncbi:MAG: PHP domain-containing protein [Oscillospiraceae bacterium]|nr:PHP domain-containing protein [Oscillospiraceae bacterium]